MAEVKTRTLWRALDAQFIDTDSDCDVVALTMQCDGKEYAVVCSGPKGMKSDEFIPAIRAASSVLLKATGGALTMAEESANDALFDTGDQRAN